MIRPLPMRSSAQQKWLGCVGMGSGMFRSVDFAGQTKLRPHCRSSSDDASYCTGTEFIVDGGLSSRVYTVPKG